MSVESWLQYLRSTLLRGRPTTDRRGRSRTSRPRAELAVESLEDRSLPSTLADYGHVPLAFEPNQGQADAVVNYLARGSDYALFLTDTATVLSLQQPGAAGSDLLRLQMVGGNPAPAVQALDQLPGTSNYLAGSGGWNRFQTWHRFRAPTPSETTTRTPQGRHGHRRSHQQQHRDQADPYREGEAPCHRRGPPKDLRFIAPPPGLHNGCETADRR
jgi:hypothetical protein